MGRSERVWLCGLWIRGVYDGPVPGIAVRTNTQMVVHCHRLCLSQPEVRESFLKLFVSCVSMAHLLHRSIAAKKLINVPQHRCSLLMNAGDVAHVPKIDAVNGCGIPRATPVQFGIEPTL